MSIRKYITEKLADRTFTLSKDEIAQKLKRPDNFGYFGDEAELFKTWALGPIVLVHHKGNLLEESNAAALQVYLNENPIIQDDWRIEFASHWAVGPVDHLSYRVINDAGQPTMIALIVKAWFEYLTEIYPIANEDDYSRRESEASWENLCEVTHRVCNRLDIEVENPGELASKVGDWLDLNDRSQMESKDGNGAYPDEGSVQDAIEAILEEV